VDNPVPVYVPLEKGLTTPAPEPAPPAFNCTDAKTGRATVCHGDLVQHLKKVLRWGKLNEAKLLEIQGLQPKPEAP
jgi:hypothetical protein